jgi:cytochrome c biogenesis protein CcmG, thiol:disulfide interchange protein DsbE
VAHWCPHCQREVPLIQKWIADGNLPKGVEVYTVSTAVSDQRPNYPPSKWLSSVGWQPKVMLDDSSQTAAQAYGLASYPYFVMTDGAGKVVTRGTGEVPIDQFGAKVDDLAKSAGTASASTTTTAAG